VVSFCVFDGSGVLFWVVFSFGFDLFHHLASHHQVHYHPLSLPSYNTISKNPSPQISTTAAVYVFEFHGKSISNALLTFVEKL
jgi:hypothetical protein